ncbi:MAG: TrbG/VirB9 family P-type conjugative transfer protein [Brevundimonas sp.]|uniref:TrbG/VirB9 family P-type conjugative transfer protein n=1 Tax=Brevundimonas sp. TaxID=1871086 RepID=UPI00258C6BD8|nr:TrbG/VirB9 family P-type conjugative transfer protein [Brevundimonas sp.]MCV0415741.1 TrbG/VirB9 family P-type conjugative transfer protein [Brevundimonas sp.]
MDPRRLLSLAALSLTLGGCALLRPAVPEVAAAASPAVAVVAIAPPPSVPEAPVLEAGSSARPYLEVAAEAAPAPPRFRERRSEPAPPRPAAEAPAQAPAQTGRPAIAAANRSARAASSADAFVGGVQMFGWREGRVYEVWTAPLRVTTLTLAPGETVTAKAAGDTVRWQIGESRSGAGGTARSHVLIKPLQSGLETNLVLTTSQRVYLLTLRSGEADAFNAAVAWDYGPEGLIADSGSPGLPPVDVTAVTPQGPLDARYRIEPRGRAPRWAPTAVFNDGVRTFITLASEAANDEAPSLFVRTEGELQLVNYRLADGLLIVDRVFDEAELRLGDRRPRIVRIRRLEGAAR